MSEIAQNLNGVKKRINDAAARCGRNPDSIRLIAVGKTKPAEMIRDAYEAGQKIFGESYVQELREKAEALADLNIEWHFVGHIQRNKVKYITPTVKCIHSLDSIRLAEEIEKRAKTKIDCLIEVNLAGEASKTGISAQETNELIKAIGPMEHINLIGLMTMPPYDPDPEKSRPYFMKLRELMNNINERGLRKLTELSMGMTDDLEVAIEEGATMVRVGTAIFQGRRTL